MPKIVDHQSRRTEIGLAVLDVVASDGLENLTVRKIATASGWSTGVLAHYARDKDEMIALAIEAMAERFVGRLQAIDTHEPREVLRTLLRELLPLDTERRTEALVWFRLATYALNRESAPVIRRGHRELRRVTTNIVASLGVDRDPEEVSTELIALADGLAVHHLVDPRGMPRTRIAATLDARIAEI